MVSLIGILISGSEAVATRRRSRSKFDWRIVSIVIGRGFADWTAVDRDEWVEADEGDGGGGGSDFERR